MTKWVYNILISNEMGDRDYMGSIEIFNFASVGKMIEKAGAKAMLVHIPFKFIEDAVFILDFEDFLSLIENNQISQVFIHEQYMEPDYYLITENTFKEIGVDANRVECLKEYIEEYNCSIESVDVEFPERVIVFLIWNGQRFYFIFENAILIDGEEVISGEEKLKELIILNEQSISEEDEIRRKLIEKQREELRQYILDDPEFKECTNNRLRRNYIIRMFEGDNVPKALKQCWVNPNGFLFHVAFDFIEAIWKEIKGGI